MEQKYGRHYVEIGSIHGELLRKYGNKRLAVLVMIEDGVETAVITADTNTYYSLENPDKSEKVWVSSSGHIMHDYFAAPSYDRCIYLRLGLGGIFESDNALTAAQWFNELWGLDPSRPTPNRLLTDKNGKRVLGYEGDEATFLSFNNDISEVAPGAFDSRRSFWWPARSSRLESVSMEGVCTIGSRAFAECTNLRNIYVTECLREIAPDAFYGCNSIEKVFIPSKMEEYFAKLLPDFCDKLEGALLNQADREDAPPDDDGVVISKSGNVLKRCENKDITHYIVPEGVTVVIKN